MAHTVTVERQAGRKEGTAPPLDESLVSVRFRAFWIYWTALLC